MMKTNTTPPNSLSRRLSLGSLFFKHFKLCSALALVVLVCADSLDAQPPAIDPPAAAPPTSAATPPDSSLSDVPNFDIDLGTEEFENFGEEDFQVEEKLSPAMESTVTYIKLAAVAAIVLLFAFIVMKWSKRKAIGPL
ncbi:MAG: hypothetical protein ABI557_16340 [Aureliella sp.]